VTFDGTGYGPDGTIWGGEFLVGDYRGYRRLAHLRAVGMPGGEQAIREPWRMGIAHLRDACIATPTMAQRVDPRALGMVEKMLDSGFNTPMTSSAGRLFDAVAALAGLRQRVSYEGQAAIELEWQAAMERDAGVYPFALKEVSKGEPPETTLIVDTRPLIREAAQDAGKGRSPGMIGRRYHNALIQMITEVCDWIRRSARLDAVVLSGGVFMNALLTSEVVARLEDDGFRVYRHRLVPPNDGGLSLGQLAIAAGLAQAGLVSENA
jgi:hydrogenase maturation protein HypF